VEHTASSLADAADMDRLPRGAAIAQGTVSLEGKWRTQQASRIATSFETVVPPDLELRQEARSCAGAYDWEQLENCTQAGH